MSKPLLTWREYTDVNGRNHRFIAGLPYEMDGNIAIHLRRSNGWHATLNASKAHMTTQQTVELAKRQCLIQVCDRIQHDAETNSHPMASRIWDEITERLSKDLKS